jgi:serine/threonine-protein kinase
VLGTAAYISPEQAVGDPATAASDRYALATVAYELLAGRRPFEAENFAAQARAHVEDEPDPASQHNPDLPPEADAVLARGLEKDPDARYGTAAEFVDELDGALSASREPTPAPTTSRTRVVGGDGRPPRRTAPAGVIADNGGPPPVRRRRAAPLLAALAGLALLAVIGVLLLSGGDGGGNDGQQAQSTSTPEKTATPEKTSTPEETATPEPTPEETATPEPTDTPEGDGGGGGGGPVDLDKARQLQVQGYNARLAGDYGQALTLSEQALDACGNSNELDPCGYALFEKGAALNRSGKPDEAIPVLQERLDRFGDNSAGEVAKELRAAKKAAG